MSGLVEVALPLPVASPYTYRVPPALAERVSVGARVTVPVRRRQMVGIVVSDAAAVPKAEPRDIIAAPDAEPVVPASLLATARWVSEYYGAPLGITLKAILPAGLWGAAQDGDTGVSERIAVLPAERLTLIERDTMFKRRPRQRALYEALESLGGAAPVRHLVEQMGFSDRLVKALADQQLAGVERAERIRDPFAEVPATPPPGPLTADQNAALAAIEALSPGDAALLYGVTGSGKTLVYLEAVRRTLDAGRSAIVLVPEIGLTPQTVSRFRGMFGDQVAVLHSGLSDGERADAWRVLRRGERRVAVGARSAVFAPVPDLGLIVVDEEHETSYKNGETPRYHARAVAQVRARLEGARLVLGSATPALETMSAVGERLRLVKLPARIAARPLPPVELVDLRHVPRVKEAAPVQWSEVLDRAVVERLALGEQVLLLLNRRGYASFLQCQDCGDVRQCPNCTISLTVHHAPGGLRCHYCGHQAPLPLTCVACAGLQQEMRGVGTQQVEEMLAARFPEARIARMDLDTTSTKWSHQRILAGVESGDVDILIGTQMIAKGLDFPNVTLVGVIDADVGLHLPDFRSAERTFQLLAQVAGRAGRGPKGGRVLVQTRNPTHHALVHAAAHDTDAFVAEEMSGRRSPPYPPETSLVNLVVSGENEGDVGRGAAWVADWCNRLVEKHSLPLTVLGPAPCPLARVKTRWRWHVALKGPGPAIGRVVRYAARRLRLKGDVRVVVDRDPVSMM